MNDQKAPNIVQVFFSVLASFFGVQSETNRERDFTHGKASHFIIAGFILTLVFIVVIWGIVQLVLNAAGV
ncbi:MAG: DUF2970 domain-containing protein [Candidatus Competibacteraceae bacterium]|jgi:hypothetical protein|nr:DUF2970 domain-containing protein [Candidatus Competibacteraceae bacterium]